METSQSVCVVMIMVMIYNENGLTVLHIRLSVFLCFFEDVSDFNDTAINLPLS